MIAGQRRRLLYRTAFAILLLSLASPVPAVESARRCLLEVKIDGVPLSVRWESAVKGLFDFADMDGSGGLSKAEAARLPSEYGLREKLWGQYLASGDGGPRWESLDADGSDAVSFDELIAWYDSKGLRGIVVSVGQCPHAERLLSALTSQVVPRLSTVQNRDDVAQLIAAFDADKNESISPGELVVGTTYPGTSATNHLRPSRGATLGNADDRSELTWTLPAQAAPIQFVQLRSDAGHDTASDSSNASEWIGTILAVNLNSAAGTAQFHGGESGNELNSNTFKFGEIQVVVAVAPGRLGEVWEASKLRFRSQFESASQGGDSVAEGYEAKLQSQLADINRLLLIADQDQDGALTRAELDKWFEVQERFAKSLIQVSIVDFGSGLFELIDTSHNGQLSASELVDASKRFGREELTDPPHQLRILFSLGSPKKLLVTEAVEGPAWFQALDRNQDGSITKSEFPAELSTFEGLDANGDGVIDVKEAGASHAKQ